MDSGNADQKEWVRRIRSAARSGARLDFGSDLTDDQLDDLNERNIAQGREIPAAAIREALFDKEFRPHPLGLRVRGAFVSGTLDFSYAQLPCRLEITFSRFENPAVFYESKLYELELASSWLPGIVLYHASITGNAEFAHLRCVGDIDATDISISGRIDLESSHLTNAAGNALSMSGAVVSGNVNLEHAVVVGEIAAPGCVLGGQLDFSDAWLTASGERAVFLDGARVGGGLYMERTRVLGEVRAIAAHFKMLDCTDANFTNGEDDALSLDLIELPQGARLDNIRITGQFRMMDCVVAGIDMDGAVLFNPGRDAATLDGAVINGRFSMDGVSVQGTFRAVGAKIAGTFAILDSQFTKAPGPAILLSYSSLNTIALADVRSEGAIALSFVDIQTLRVAATETSSNFPGLESAQGWRLGSIEGFLGTDRNLARDWLDTIKATSTEKRNFGAQPWQELARVYAQMGQTEDGKWLLFQAAKRTTRSASWFAKPIRWAYAGLVGYGYYPFLAVVWLIVTFFLALGLASSNPSAFTPTNVTMAYELDANGTATQILVTGASTHQPAAYPKFTPWLTAIDATLPAAATGQALAWRIADSAWLYGAFAGLKTFSWILVALTVAAITGLLRKG